MHRPSETQGPRPRLRPAPLGILGWLLVLASLTLSLTAPWPYTGHTLAAMVTAGVGVALVGWQVKRSEARR